MLSLYQVASILPLLLTATCAYPAAANSPQTLPSGNIWTPINEFQSIPNGNGTRSTVLVLGRIIPASSEKSRITATAQTVGGLDLIAEAPMTVGNWQLKVGPGLIAGVANWQAASINSGNPKAGLSAGKVFSCGRDEASKCNQDYYFYEFSASQMIHFGGPEPGFPSSSIIMDARNIFMHKYPNAYGGVAALRQSGSFPRSSTVCKVVATFGFCSGKWGDNCVTPKAAFSVGQGGC